MVNHSFHNLCIYNIYDGLCEGLSHFSQPSRVALIYAADPCDSLRIYDPQDLLNGHEPKLKEIYIDSDCWREASDCCSLKPYEVAYCPKNADFSGLISISGRSKSVFFQNWFTEHHPDMCSTGPTERWLEHAISLLAQDVAFDNVMCIGNSGYVVREYSTHAVRDYIVDRMNMILGWDIHIRVYPILDTVLGISKTREEGVWPKGDIVFVEPKKIKEIEFLVKFPYAERPMLEQFKHVRKLLTSVENSERKLISDGKSIVGIGIGDVPGCLISAEFNGMFGFLKFYNEYVASFFDGNFHSTTRRAKLVQVEETLLESEWVKNPNDLFKIVSAIVHHAENGKYGCTLVIDLNEKPLAIQGQHFESPLNLMDERILPLACSLSKLDGAVHIGVDMMLHGCACLLDGDSVPGENLARGARYNSAMRFTAKHPNILVIVVSSDRPVSIFQGGVELNALCEWKPRKSGLSDDPPTLLEWLNKRNK